MHKNKYAGYTYVDREGNDILFMGYGHEGEPVKERIRFRPELFIERKTGEYKTIDGKTCDRKDFASMGECYDFVKQNKDIMKLYGCS
ncbi:MAG TPA: hypothetical protein VFM18_05070, partial [Methanosarcina sp.]|nr:hypothetical protein [Methanosarcina sp.]